MYKRQPDQKKYISCMRCQDRKAKCSRTSPCQRCTAAGVQCEFRGDGRKRAPISREYVTALESRIGALESFLSDLKAAPSHEQEAMINAIEFGGHLLPVVGSSDLNSLSHESPDAVRCSESLIRPYDKPMIYHGPRSLCNSKLLKFACQSLSVPHTPPLSPICNAVRANFPSQIIAECLALFFRWHYPHCMLIDRDEFLLDYFDPSVKYSSPALEFSLCALGALMSTDVNIRSLADSFAISATRILESEGLFNPQETSVQALVLCSFYQIGKGDFSKGWMLSGVAFRMSEDLRDREVTQEQLNGHQSTPRDIESRRRMFRNCYESDKMISLLLGGPAAIYEKTINMGHHDPGKTSSLWHNWLEQNGLSYLQDPETSVDLSTVLRKQVELCDIINDMLLQKNSSKRRPTTQQTSQRWTEVILNELNSKLWRWHNTLPGDLRWNRWGSSLDIVHPSIAALHMLYHTTQMSLNLPFLTSEQKIQAPSPTAPAKLIADALKICGTSVDMVLSILHRFKSQYTLKAAPLVFVHGAITAADATLAMTHFQSGMNTVSQDKNLHALDEALLGLSYSWTFAADARVGMRKLLTEGHTTKQVVILSSSLASEEQLSRIMSGSGSGSGSYCAYATSSVGGRYGTNFPGSDPSNTLSFGACDMANPFLWDPDLLNEGLSKSRESDTGVLDGNGAMIFGAGLESRSVNYL